MNNEMKELEFEKILALLFIICSIINLLGDNIEQKYYVTKNKIDKQKAKTLFIISLIIVLLIYIYYFNRNYNILKKSIHSNKNTFNESIRTYGTILLIIGIICFIYYQISDDNSFGSPPV